MDLGYKRFRYSNKDRDGQRKKKAKKRYWLKLF